LREDSEAVAAAEAAEGSVAVEAIAFKAEAAVVEDAASMAAAAEGVVSTAGERGTEHLP
jgi:hypothetical protein